MTAAPPARMNVQVPASKASNMLKIANSGMADCFKQRDVKDLPRFQGLPPFGLLNYDWLHALS